MKKVLVTGATGFVGRHLLHSLENWRIRAAVRKECTLPPNVSQVTVGAIDPQTRWDDALDETDCVIHLAAHVHVMAPTADDARRFHDVNVVATENLARRAAERGVKRFVFLSSVKVNGEATHEVAYKADDRPNPVDEYGKSKRDAESRLMEVAARSNMDVIAIRPPLVYGPGVNANFLRLMSWVHRGIPLPLGAVNNRRSLISVWNLCDMIHRAIDTPEIASCVMMASDGEDLSTPDLIRRLARAMGKKSRLISVPPLFLRTAGSLLGRSAEIARLCGSLVVEIEDTKRKLNWTPPISVDEGLARTARSYLDQLDARHR